MCWIDGEHRTLSPTNATVGSRLVSCVRACVCCSVRRGRWCVLCRMTSGQRIRPATRTDTRNNCVCSFGFLA